MRVLQVLYSGLGGHASVAFSLIDGDTESACAHSLLFYGIEPLRNEYADKCKVLKIPFEVVIKRNKNIVYDWVRVIRNISKLRPDIIILHSLTLVLPVALYCRLKGIRIVAVEHTPNNVKSRIEKMSSGFAMMLVPRIVLLTELYQGELKSLLGKRFREKKVCIINNGINTERFSPGPALPNKMRIGMAGRFAASKDFAGLVKAFAMLIKRAGGNEIYLVLAGDGYESSNVAELIEKLDLKSRVTLTGNLEETELIDFYRSLTLYVHASKGETMSTSIMQAMACGLPVLATDIPGINNMVLDGENGMLTPPGDSAALCDNIAVLLADKERRRLLSQNARAFAINHFSHVAMFKKYSMIINKEVSQR